MAGDLLIGFDFCPYLTWEKKEGFKVSCNFLMDFLPRNIGEFRDLSMKLQLFLS